MLLLLWSAGPSVAQPSITLGLAPIATVTLWTAQATPGIRLSVLAVANPFAQASPSIRLSLGPVLGDQPGQATASITLSLAPAVLVISRATSAPSVTLALGPVTRQTHISTASPRVRLALDVQAIGGFTPAGSTVVGMEYNAGGSTVTGDQRISFDASGVSTLTLRVKD